jgi:hypothetical protein
MMRRRVDGPPRSPDRAGCGTRLGQSDGLLSIRRSNDDVFRFLHMFFFGGAALATFQIANAFFQKGSIGPS